MTRDPWVTLSSPYQFRSQRAWYQIPLYENHDCIESYCQWRTMAPDESGRIRFVRDPSIRTDTCPSTGVLSPTCISLEEYDPDDPRGLQGGLFGLDTYVIRECLITLCITMPLTVPAEMELRTSDPDGFTLRTLLKEIQRAYRYVYTREEEEATVQTWEFQRPCMCLLDTSTQTLPTVSSDTLPEQHDPCAICYDPFEESTLYELPCHHRFHVACIDTWISRGRGRTCPLCRESLWQCNECNGTHIIQQSIESAVAPPLLQLGQSGESRNTTDGPYGIHTFHLHELYIGSMIYNRFMRRLRVKVNASTL
jgi:hypothetical protein